MNCDETELLLHALIDGELDAGHARDVENHVAAHEHEIGRGLDRVDGRDAFFVTLGRMPAVGDMLVCEVNEAEGTRRSG